MIYESYKLQHSKKKPKKSNIEKEKSQKETKETKRQRDKETKRQRDSLSFFLQSIQTSASY